MRPEHAEEQYDAMSPRQVIAAQDRRISEQLKKPNTVKVYGCTRIRGIKHFLVVCSKKGIPLKQCKVIDVRRAGYRSVRYDSRHFRIQLSSERDAQVLNCAFSHAEQYQPEMRGWRHELVYTELGDANPFAVLEDLHVEQASVQNDVRVCCWNINTARNKADEIRTFIKRNDVQILGLVETGGDAECLRAKIPGFVWFGRAKSRRAGGVGFLVDESIITSTRVQTTKGRAPDTLFLLVTPENSRSTLFMLVYGKAAASKDESNKQWESYAADYRRQLRKCPDDTDVVFLGDINARMGKAKNEADEGHISSSGEDFRNAAGADALAFLQQVDLVCLNDRDRGRGCPQYTYREKGQSGQSVIDVICVSRGMYRPSLRATVLQETLTGRESHFPVTTSIRWHRRRPRKRRAPRKHIWARRKLQDEDVRRKFQEKYEAHIDAVRLGATTEESAKALRKVLIQAADEVIGKNEVGNKVQCSRLEKRRSKKASELRRYREVNSKALAAMSEEHRTREKELEQQLKQLREKVKIENQRRLARKLARKQKDGDVRGVMQVVREFNPERAPQNPPITCVIDRNHLCQTSTEAILQVFTAYWKPRLQNPHFATEMKEIDVGALAEMKHDPMCDSQITMSELERALATLEFHKTQGLDGVLPAFFTRPSEKLKLFLLEIFNQVLVTGKFPSEWKTDKRTPIHKSGRTTDVDKYRLLAIHAVCRKIFCSIAKYRVDGIIVLDDAQNGFRRNRRASDNVAIIQGIVQAARKHGDGAQLLVADFSKAFDTCHIPTLLKKLAKYGIRGQLLRVIADMYTNANARMCVNGVLGDRIEVTNGVAQGCVLSPVFFTIYIDELLIKFRESGLGVPIGALIQSALSFADDLILASPNDSTSEKYLQILESWCADNKLRINAGKSGVLRCGEVLQPAAHRLCINGKQLQLLEEDDPEFKKPRKFEYLGTSFDSSGDWNRYLETQMGKMRKALGSNYAFFREAPVPIRMKVQTAKTLVFSLSSYCADISHTTARKDNQFDAIQAETFRAILQLPKHTPHARIRHILGQPRLSSSRLRARVANFSRIRTLPRGTTLREIYEDGAWRQRSRLFGKYEVDLAYVKTQCKHSSVSVDDLEQALASGSTPKTRALLKKLTAEADVAENAHHNLRSRCPELLHWTPSLEHPMWRESAYSVGAHARWLTGSTWVAGTTLFDADAEYTCERCGYRALSRDASMHSLVQCEEEHASQARSKFVAALGAVSGDTRRRFESMLPEEQFRWLLAGGVVFNSNPDSKSNNRVQRRSSPFIAGESVAAIHGKKDPWTNWLSYDQFRTIHSKNYADLQVYTDGSAPDSFAGLGVVIKQPGSDDYIYQCSKEIGKTTNNVAELEAIHNALQWITDNSSTALRPGQAIRLYTDSQYARNVLLAPRPPRDNFYLIESILSIGARLKYDLRTEVTLHWIPSHIEMTAFGWLPIQGNCDADKLAEAARLRSRSEHSPRQVEIVRSKTRKAISDFLKTMEKMFRPPKDLIPPNGSSADDFDIDAYQEIPSASCDI